jgi:hypothetical protein
MQKYMAEIEMKVSENVMKACARTPSVTKCVLTSSLLACIWRDNTQYDLSSVVNHDCWSDESLCTDKKVFFFFFFPIKIHFLGDRISHATILILIFHNMASSGIPWAR